MQEPLCLLELTATPVPDQQNGTQMDLFVTMHFHPQWQTIERGRFQVGLRGGELKLRLENAMATDYKEVSKESIAIAQSQCQLDPTGTDTSPTWIFKGERGTPIFQGTVPMLKLGTLQVIQNPMVVEATFNVEACDVQILATQGLWPHDITPNKHSILDRTLIRSLVQYKLQPYVNRIELRFSESTLPPRVISSKVEASEQHLLHLNQAIADIVSADTNHLLALADIAQLNLLQDLAGANLLGSTLNEVDLTGANLERANLRGADWNDVDLSGANLSQANLAGADLSGSLLSDVNFSGANLQRCSLALANLSGANLSGANLSEANLSQANLSDANLTDANLMGADLHGAGLVRTQLTGVNWENAQVKQARFKLDSGLSEQMQQTLQAQGAIVEYV